MTTKEYTFENENEAHVARRAWIKSGFNVSLIAYDPTRNAYTFDLITKD